MLWIHYGTKFTLAATFSKLAREMSEKQTKNTSIMKDRLVNKIIILSSWIAYLFEDKITDEGDLNFL